MTPEEKQLKEQRDRYYEQARHDEVLRYPKTPMFGNPHGTYNGAKPENMTSGQHATMILRLNVYKSINRDPVTKASTLSRADHDEVENMIQLHASHAANPSTRSSPMDTTLSKYSNEALKQAIERAKVKAKGSAAIIQKLDDLKEHVKSGFRTDISHVGGMVLSSVKAQIDKHEDYLSHYYKHKDKPATTFEDSILGGLGINPKPTRFERDYERNLKAADKASVASATTVNQVHAGKIAQSPAHQPHMGPVQVGPRGGHFTVVNGRKVYGKGK